MADGAAVALLCGTQSEFAQQAADSCLRLLGPELSSRVRVFTFCLAGEWQGSSEGRARASRQ